MEAPWDQVIADLEEVGLSQKEIADKVGCSSPYVSQLKIRKRRIGRAFEIGTALMRLHRERRPDRYTQQHDAAEKAG